MSQVRTIAMYQGCTAGEILASAKVTQMQAGTYSITADILPGHILERVEDSGSLVIAHEGGAVGQMRISDSEAGVLDRLVLACERAYLL